MKILNFMHAERQISELHASNDQQINGHCSDKTSSEKMKITLNNLRCLISMILILSPVFTIAQSKSDVSTGPDIYGGNFGSGSYDNHLVGPGAFPGSVTIHGNANTMFGCNACLNANNASRNSTFGAYCGSYIHNGTDNSIFGHNAANSLTDGGYNSIFGSFSAYTMTGSQNTMFGYEDGYSIGSGSYNIMVGYQAGNSSNGDSYNLFIGNQAGYTNNGASYNFFVGHSAGYYNTTGDHNHFEGLVAGNNNSTGQDNTFIGCHAGEYNSTASANHFVGFQAGRFNTDGFSNFFDGYQAGMNNVHGLLDHYSGFEAGVNSTGNYNTFVGPNTGSSDISGSGITLLGNNANVGIGHTSLTDAAAIGYNATVSQNYEMVFGDGGTDGNMKWGFGEDVTETGAVIQVKTGTSTDIYAVAGGGLWMTGCDRNLKENFKEIDENSILQKVINLPITQWNYKKDQSRTFIGPMAQDFYAAFQLGNDSTHIAEIEPGNIALVAVKALGKQNLSLQQQNANLVTQVQSLASQNEGLQQTVTYLQSQNSQLQNSVSDLQDKYNMLLSEIENIKTMQAQCCGSIGLNSTGNTNINNAGNDNDQPSLAQNVPNPFNQNTVISYYLPANMPNAVITIRSTTGTTLQSYNISSAGHGQITVSQGALAPATYEYDMMVNGKLIDTKKMIIVGE